MDKNNLLLSFSIGDGTLSGNRLSIVHSIKQLEYIEWKEQLLLESGIKVTKRFFNNNKFPAVQIYTKRSNEIGKLKHKLYTPLKSYKFFVENLSIFNLAVLYMDDGSISSTKKKAVLTISTCTTKEENQYIIDAIKEKYNISFGIRKMGKSYALICGTKEARKFLTLISKVVSQVKCMHYKLKLKNEFYLSDPMY